MTTIDEATGLPALPEGMFWRIGEHCIRIMYEGVWTDWSKDDWLRGTFEEEPVREVETYSGVLFIRKKVEKEFRRRSPYLVSLKRYGEFTGKYPFRTLEKPDPVTPENVVERCQEVLAAYNEKVEREALYGDYPPKKFEGV